MADISGNQSKIIELMLASNKRHRFEDAIEDNRKRIEDDLLENKTTIVDSYGNSLLSVGNDDIHKKFDNYSWSNDTLNYTLWLALYNCSWVVKRAINKPARDEVRAGISIQGNSDFSKVYLQLNKARQSMIELLQWGALFGGAIAVMMFDNFKDNDYATTISLEKLSQAKTIRYYVTDRWYGVQASSTTVSDMNSLDFGKPDSYVVTFADGKQLKVHHDFILRCEGGTAPKLVKKI